MTSKIYTITAAFDAAELKKQNVLGKKIAESRVSSGMSQKELAEEGVSAEEAEELLQREGLILSAEENPIYRVN